MFAYVWLHVHFLFFGRILYLFTSLSRAQVWARCAGWSWEHRAQSAGGTRAADFGSLGLSLWESQSSKCILNNRKLLHICQCVPVLAREPPRDCLSIFCPFSHTGPLSYWELGCAQIHHYHQLRESFGVDGWRVLTGCCYFEYDGLDFRIIGWTWWS